MITSRRLSSRKALRAALRSRRDAGVEFDVPISALDFADRPDEVEVWIVNEPRLEGMYELSHPSRILVSSHRTLGRQAMSCAHEFGHHIFGHGTRWDLYFEDEKYKRTDSDEEWLADDFARSLLMPREAVERALDDRGLAPEECSSVDLYRISCQLGVSYRALIQQLLWSLDMLPQHRAMQLLAESPKEIRRSLLGRDLNAELHLVDAWWFGRAVDCRVGDVLIVEKEVSVDGSSAVIEASSAGRTVLSCARQGIARIVALDGALSVNVRVSRRYDARRGYHGLAAYRHDEDPDDVLPT